MNKPSPFIYMAAFVLALGVGIVLTPLARKFAYRAGLSDVPSDRKAHPEPIALLGGVAIFGAAAATVFLLFPSASEPLKGIFLGGLVILFVGLQDDLKGMDPLVKLFGQVVAGMVLVGFGLKGNVTGQPLADSALTIAWIVVVVNAVNLSDNMDGLAAGLAAVASISYFAIGVVWGQYLVATLAAVLAGGVVGFLVYNFPPARIYMGDAGSHILGFLLAVMGLNLRFPTRPYLVSVFVPVLVLGVPLLDMAMVSWSRWRRGDPISLGGTDHSSHRLVHRGFSRRQAIVLEWVCGLIFGALALAVSLLPTGAALTLVALATVVGIVAIVYFEKIGTPPSLVYERDASVSERDGDVPDRGSGDD